jgi:predicted transglutaminase-like cysteine proteinase
MPTGAEHGPIPPGFVSFCMRFSSQCQVSENQPEIAILTPQNWGLLGQVNERVNASIWPEDDERHYGRGEFWTIPTDGYGDCEDFALTKRKTLIDAGLPGRALRIGIVVTTRDARHAVLTVVTDKGDYVLDSLTDDVVPWNQAGYRWLERQDGSNVTQWVALDAAPTQLATAAH